MAGPTAPEGVDGSVALVTGGNRGIGRATVRALTESGMTAIAGCRSGESPDGHPAVRMDVSSTDSVESAFADVEQQFGPVSVLVANAGITRDTLLMRMSDADIEDVLQANLIGAIRCARRAVRGMLKARHGRIILVSSVVWAVGSAGQVNYAAAKAGLVGAGRSMARELGSRGITVNIVAPGFIETDMTAALDDDQRSSILGGIPAGRYGAPEEVAGVIAFLAGADSGYINGAVIPVDGGLGMGH